MVRRAPVLLVAFALLLTACSPAPAPAPQKSGQGQVSVRPTETPKASYPDVSKVRVNLKKPANYNNAFAVDLRHHNLTDQDLAQAGEVLFGYASFDTVTKWPAVLPAGYDPAKILELGKDPGLGIRQLHQQGITGKGVRIAFLDQPLLVEHEEYRGQVEEYRIIGVEDRTAKMHGSAVVSILAGKSVGVAPDALVTYYAVDQAVAGGQSWVNHAKAIHEILDENIDLPAEKRIRVIGISWGYMPDSHGYQEIKAAVARAKREGVLVLTTGPDADYDFSYLGLNREPLSDPNEVDAYGPGSYLKDFFYQQPEGLAESILVPMDSRTTAGPGGISEYVFYRVGGMSWVVPYLVGVYALGLQVKPDLTPDEFFRTAMKTGSYTELTHGGKTYRFGPILNPAALIERLH